MLLPALVALAFYHPLVPIPFFFGWLYLGWTDRRLRHGRFLAVAALMLAVLFVKSQYYDNWYDAAKMATFRENLAAHFPNYFTFPAYGRILDWTWRYWWGWPLLLLLSAVRLMALR